jgi:hypothetical protein
VKVEVIQKQSIMGYHANKLRPFLEITLDQPKMCPGLRRTFFVVAFV